ncbi:hypothetical protein HMPREF0293_1504 [Corynebacterium glucuronolyticum ATCC 51866]|uniref:Uncharacterized protein n=1 Tax=Corynebacterium glucuronolyticum ATCC 51866 TaxID=548478 RepID=A0ABP2DWT7_9CORY|nr:hypothetical protein HMPREF0293_1504 [Corynebacterium glucuronolyticum ATCC 51866]
MCHGEVFLSHRIVKSRVRYMHECRPHTASVVYHLLSVDQTALLPSPSSSLKKHSATDENARGI